MAIAARGTPPWVRVSMNSDAEIARVLDAGARGVIVPLIDTAAEAHAAARAAGYPISGGRRSYGPMRLGSQPDAEADNAMHYLNAARTFVSALADEGRGMTYLIG